jgi:hypothetical protein
MIPKPRGGERPLGIPTLSRGLGAAFEPNLSTQSDPVAGGLAPDGSGTIVRPFARTRTFCMVSLPSWSPQYWSRVGLTRRITADRVRQQAPKDTPSVDERRFHCRYPLDADLEYTLLYRGRVVGNGQGRIVNVSSHGVLFESGEALPLGMWVELSIEWPVPVSGQMGLTLHATGRIVRVQGNRTAVRIDHHDFRMWPRRKVG